jgi:hypothetical protein
MNDKDDKSPEPEESQGRDTGDIKPPTREEDEPPAQEVGQRGTGDIKPPTE